MKHEFQHPDAPTWCVHCGTFNEYCVPEEECSAEPTRKFDYNVPENWKPLIVETK